MQLAPERRDGLRLTRPASLWKLAQQINAGVFQGEGRVLRRSVLDALPEIEAAVAYFDPPYPGVMSYEREYKVIDEILEGAARPTSPFTARTGAALLDQLFERALHIPVWVLSLGNAVVMIEELEGKMARLGRSTRAVEVRYPHLPAVATEEKKAANREFVVVGWDPAAVVRLSRATARRSGSWGTRIGSLEFGRSGPERARREGSAGTMNRVPRPLLILGLGVMALVASLMVPALWSNAVDWVRNKRADWRLEQERRPPPPLPIRSEDFLRFPREGFGFVLRAEGGGFVDTFRGLATKHLVVRPDTTIRLVLSDAELDTIYSKMIEVRFFEYPEPHPPIEIGGRVSPSAWIWLRTRAGTVEKALSWDTRWTHKGRTPDEWKRLNELLKLIRTIVYNRPEFRTRPARQGGHG